MTRALFVAWLALSAACDHDTRFFGRVQPHRPPDELVLNLSSEPESIDPGLAAESAGGMLIRNTFAGLVQAHPQTLEPMPDVATRWDVSNDGTRYTFHLRPSTWSDGRPLTAHDFEWSFKRVLDPETASKYASFAYCFANGAAFHQSALLLTGPPPSVEPAEVMAILGATVSLDRVERIEWPEAGYLVFVGGDAAAQEVGRRVLLDHFDGKQAWGSRLHLERADSSIVGVRTIDDHTLEVRLANPLPYFLSQLTFYTFRPVPRHVLRRLEDEGSNPALWTRVEHFVSNGPFVLSESRFRQHYVLTRNERYWDADRVRLRRVRALIVDNANTTLNLYRTGDLDWIGQNAVVPSEFVGALRRYEDFTSHAWLGVYFYWFNVNAPPLDDVRVRRALSLSIDREALTRHITRGGQIPLAGLVPDGTAGYRAPSRVLFDPRRARALLTEAGYPQGRGLPRINLSYNTSESHKQIAETLQQMWKTHLGIEVTLENQEWKVFLDRVASMDFQLARMGWIGDYNDPHTFLELLSRHNGNNHSGWSSRRYDALLTEANRIGDRDERFGKLREAEELVLEELPFLPIYVYTRNDLVKPYVRGYWGNIQNIHPLKWMSIDRRFYRGVPGDWQRDDLPPDAASAGLPR